ncbi:MAG: flagellar protein FlgN [Gammaproteobacteria bacterium]|jgi:flagellar biosynthesis protein FlgN|nr:flagellar protein FlgN [Gammaproteobacteria bacterium]MBU0773478.1 flagellar protein FlgN [Gammaproteobacteria bacterium]MBU0856688.1 flagellar protein FlgN [Gammaproteobacteria bacterium]MBU1846782.1 flagellar protein FlgN [Gammaproteobacteria bacterium]
MKRADAVLRLVRDMHSDAAAYRDLRTLLDAQFDAAVRHDAVAVRDIAGHIAESVERLDARRVLRVRLVTQLFGADARMDSMFDAMATDNGVRCRALWQELEEHVVECKRLNARNCALMSDQYEIMTRLLHGEDQTYAPA